MHAGEDDNDEEKDEEKMDTSVEEKSPLKEEVKTEVKQEKDSDNDNSDKSKNPEAKEPNKLLSEEKTVKSESSEEDSCKIKGAVSVSSDAVENKENETKGDDK